jgi:putative ubiquitin-RnfH superfamily antitoxin RatB of RatAB toxin-antitoxin module
MRLSSERSKFMAHKENEEKPNIRVEVVYALPQEQVVVSLQVDSGTTLAQAIECSGLLERYPEIDLSRNRVGIFGKLVDLDATLRDRDRVEIYRPLLADPKEARRRRAKGK